MGGVAVHLLERSSQVSEPVGLPHLLQRLVVKRRLAEAMDLEGHDLAVNPEPVHLVSLAVVLVDEPEQGQGVAAGLLLEIPLDDVQVDGVRFHLCTLQRATLVRVQDTCPGR